MTVATQGWHWVSPWGDNGETRVALVIWSQFSPSAQWYKPLSCSPPHCLTVVWPKSPQWYLPSPPVSPQWYLPHLPHLPASPEASPLPLPPPPGPLRCPGSPPLPSGLPGAAGAALPRSVAPPQWRHGAARLPPRGARDRRRRSFRSVSSPCPVLSPWEGSPVLCNVPTLSSRFPLSSESLHCPCHPQAVPDVPRRVCRRRLSLIHGFL